jgi:hypothetical protein
MKQYLAIAAISFAIACTSSNAKDAGTDAPAITDNNAEQNKAVVTKFMDAELKGDTTAMSALMTDDYIQYGLGVNDNADKKKTLNGVQHHWEVYKYGGKRYKSIETIAVTTAQDGGRGRGKGDWVLLWGDLATDYPSTADYGNKAITATFAYHAAYRVKNGKIDTRTIYFNHEDIMRQLGYKMISVDEQQKHASANLKLK